MVLLEEPTTLREQRWYLEGRKYDLQQELKETLGSVNEFILNRELDQVNKELKKLNEQIREEELTGKDEEEPEL